MTRSQASFGVYKFTADDFGEFDRAARQILRQAGCTIGRRRNMGDRGISIEAMHGNQLVAIILSYIPGIDLLGWGSRVGVRIRAMRSLNEGDDRILVSVRATAMRELEDAEETSMSQSLLGATQSFTESIGDHAKTKRVYRSIVDELEGQGLIERKGRSDSKA